MKTLKWRKEKKRLWTKVFLMNIVIFLLAQIIFQPSFETVDDNYMAGILYGAYGEYNAHLIFSNIILEKILKILMGICPILPWYSAVQYAGIFLAFVSITYILMKDENNQYRTILSWVFLIVFGYECYVKIQFTKTAGVLTIAGILLLYHAIREAKIHIISLILGIGLALLGSFGRFKAFLMVIPIIGSIPLFAGLRDMKDGHRRKFARYVIGYGGLLFLCIFLNIVSNRVYEGNSEWRNFKKFNADRTEMLDYGFPDYEENREVYRQNGISKNDLEFYKHWNYGDPERFTEEVLVNLAKAKEEKTFGINIIRDFLLQFPSRYLRYPYFCTILIAITLWIMNTKRDRITVSFAMAFFVLIELCLFYQGRYFINRIDMPLFMALYVVLAMQIEKTRYEGLNKYVIAIVIGGVLFNSSSFLTEQALPTSGKEKQEAQEVFNLMNADKSHFYIMENYTCDDLWATAYSVWDIPPVGVSTNIDVMGSWRYNTPFSNYNKKAYGIENPFRDIIDNPNVYMVNDYCMSETMNYIKEHYNKDVTAKLVKEIHGHRFYKIISKRPILKTEIAKTFDDTITCHMAVTKNENGGNVLEGSVCKEGVNAYYQQVYISRVDKESQKEYFYPMKMMEKSWKADWNEKYSWYSIPLEDLKIYDKEEIMQNDWKIYLEVDGELYVQPLHIDE